MLYRVPFSKLSVTSHSLHCRLPTVWNQLPVSPKETTSISVFKIKFTELLLVEQRTVDEILRHNCKKSFQIIVFLNYNLISLIALCDILLKRLDFKMILYFVVILLRYMRNNRINVICDRSGNKTSYLISLFNIC